MRVKEEVKAGRMRQDFLYCLYIIPVHVHPLRDRKEDIPLLVEYFLDQYESDTVPPISPSVIKALQQYDWPGNVRELQNTLKRFVALKKLDFMGLNLDGESQEQALNVIDLEIQGCPLSVILSTWKKRYC